ncbi:CPBP family intramembrane metalloprotease [Campylobacter coli]|nr:CPBP family intramembrane metalloprotease [Campylobacter coli]
MILTFILLALALALLSFKKIKLSFVVLVISGFLAYYHNIIEISFIVFAGVFFLLSLYYKNNKNVFLELLIVAFCLLLFLHFIPGVNNVKILDKVHASEHSSAFTLYFSFDKPLGVFLLFLLMPSLFENLNRIKPKLFQAALLFASPFLLLSIPWYLGVIKMEIGFPSWIVYFLFSNLFLVALVEEAFFRGYLQQRLQGLIGSVGALLVASLAFGVAHYKAGILMIIFASLAGLIYGIAWRYSKSLWLSVFFHYGLNLTHLFFFTYPSYVK